MDASQHWDAIYATMATDEVSWFQPDATTSLRLLDTWVPHSVSVLDVGAGDSKLVDFLLRAGWTDLTVLDVSTEALNKVRDRLGDRAKGVRFVNADVRTWEPGRTYEAWHDRAHFHFFVQPTDRDGYVEVATKAVAPGGVLVLGTFATDGPTQCSGLPTAGYDTEGLAEIFRSGFILEYGEREEHTTPTGEVQAFTWVVLRRTRTT